MTFDELVQDVMDRLNLTSTDARNRVETGINDNYRIVTSAIGLVTSRRIVKQVTIQPDHPSLPEYVVEGMEKVLRITVIESGGAVRLLENLSYDDIANERVRTGRPTAWAVKRMGSDKVTIRFDGFPEDAPVTFSIEGYDLADVLADDAEPAFPADFHDIIVEATLMDELLKMEKPALAAISERRYDQRLSDLRMFLAKSAYFDMVQANKSTRPFRSPWWKQWQ